MGDVMAEGGIYDWFPQAVPVCSRLSPDFFRFGSITIERFGKLGRIGEGMASRVYKVIDLHTNQIYALKAYYLPSLSDAMHHALRREIDIHKDLDHPHIVPLLVAFRDEGFLCVVMPFTPRGSLSDSRSDIAHDEKILASRVLTPVVSALGYLHSKGIVHRDVKLENVLATETGHVYLSDLGFALREEPRVRAMTQLGTLMAMAPEVLLNDPSDVNGPLRQHVPRDSRNPYGPPADIWALGVMAWELLTGTALFHGDDADAMVSYMAKHPVEKRRELSALSKDARSFILRCLVWEEDGRPTAWQLYGHPFLTRNTPAEKHARLAPALPRDVMAKDDCGGASLDKTVHYGPRIVGEPTAAAALPSFGSVLASSDWMRSPLKSLPSTTRSRTMGMSAGPTTACSTPPVGILGAPKTAPGTPPTGVLACAKGSAETTVLGRGSPSTTLSLSFNSIGRAQSESRQHGSIAAVTMLGWPSAETAAPKRRARRSRKVADASAPEEVAPQGQSGPAVGILRRMLCAGRMAADSDDTTVHHH